MSVDKIHRNKVLIRMKYSKRLVAAKLDVITMVIVPLFISHPREWWRNETSCAIERSFIRVEIKFLVSQPYRYIDCVEFLSKVRLRLIRPGSEILSRLFSFFFFFCLKNPAENHFSFFSFSFSLAILPMLSRYIRLFSAGYVTNWKWTMKEQKFQIQIVMQSLS